MSPYLEGRRIASLRVREPRLRYPVTPDMVEAVAGQAIRALRRRGKYLLLELERGTLLIHLGMSGSLRVLSPSTHRGPMTTSIWCWWTALACGCATRADSVSSCGLMGRRRRTP